MLMANAMDTQRLNNHLHKRYIASFLAAATSSSSRRKNTTTQSREARPDDLASETPQSSDDLFTQNESKTSFLDLPYEIRHEILELVLKSQRFLSSRQQLPASFLPTAEESRTFTSTSNPQTAVDSSTTARNQISSQSRFHVPSSLFRRYAESRHAETAILYTCRQIRTEALPIYYSQKYYLTLVLENPIKKLDIPSSNTPSNPDNPPAPINNQNKHTQAITFNPTSQQTFWQRIHHELSWPTYPTITAFHKFHISLFLEETMFVDVDRTFRLENGLQTKEILRTLLNCSPNDVDNSKIESRTDIDNDGEVECGSEKDDKTGVTRGEPDFREVRFMDHTYLDIARDAIDESVPTQNKGTPDAKVSFSVELWRM